MKKSTLADILQKSTKSLDDAEVQIDKALKC